MIEALQILGPSTGGIRVHVATLASHLAGLGVDAPVVGPAAVMAGLGPQAGVVEVPAGLSPVALRRARRQLRSWRSGADVVHAHGLKAAWTVVGGRPGRPLVVTVHNVVLDDAGGRGVTVRRRLERAVLRRADRVIAPTQAIAEDLRDVVEQTRLRVIVPASPVPVIDRTRREVRDVLGVSDDTPLVVCVARLHPQKDLPTLLTAWRAVRRSVPTARLAVVGEGPDRPALESTIAGFDEPGSVDLVGFDGHAVDWLGAADVVALTSVWEAIPLVLAEAMQLGIPVVSTDVGLAGELLGDGTTGAVVGVGDHEGLARHLVALLAAPGSARAAGRAAVERASALFDPGRLSAEVADVYRELTEVGDRT